MADLRLHNDLLRSLFQAQKTQSLVQSSDKGMKTKKLFCADYLQETVWVRCLASLMTPVQETDIILLRGGLHLPNFSENPNNVRKWVGGVNACSDWKCPTLDNFGQFSKVQWLSRSVLLEVKNLCLLSISRSFLLLEARGRWELRINVDLPWPTQSIRPFSLAWQISCGQFTSQRHLY